MTVKRMLLAAVAALVAAGVVARAQAPAAALPTVTITSPEAGSYANGPITLHARIEPQTDVVQRHLLRRRPPALRRRRLPFECEWDAGQNDH